MSELLDPKEFIITRKRKKYKFALFQNSPLCFEADAWKNEPSVDVLEMGAGTGLFSVAQAELAPNNQFLAMDVKADRLQKGAKEATDKDVENVRFLRGYADQLPELLPAHSLKAIWVTFPDPFPKARAAKRRLLHPHFLALYASLLRKDGVLYFKTDAHILFEWGLEQLVGTGWNIQELSFDLHESSLDDSYKLKTTYERRYMSEGLKIHFVKAALPNL